MGFQVEVGIPAITVFIQGLLSFFSPCVLPLVPLYIGYLAGGTRTVDDEGNVTYSRKKVMVNTLFFVIGVSFAFFLLGFGFTAAGKFFGGNRTMFARIGGIIVVMFGLYQLGVFGSGLLSKEHRLPFRLDQLAMNPVLALILGFTFSFAWTPCVGPALASVLLMASSASSQAMGFLLIGVYTLGFVIPFLAVGLFTGSVLDFFKRHQNVVKYTTKAGGVLMIIMGVMMFTGWMNGVTGYLSRFGAGGAAVESQKGPDGGDTAALAETKDGSSAAGDKAAAEDKTGGAAENDAAASGEADGTGEEASLPDTENRVEAPDFTLTDQFGTEHKLSDYKGKVVFLNFWATWCGPCRQEMPDIQELYEEYEENAGDLVILSVANPKTAENPNNNDVTIEEVTEFMKENGYSYPSLMDTTGDVLLNYYISAFPTTFMIDRQGRVIGYATGTLTKDIMTSIITQALAESES